MYNVLVIDSGLGGATILKRILEKCENLSVCFYVENKYSPLGNYSQEELKLICDDIIESRLKIKSLDLLVLACNTLTSACIIYLREKYSFPIIGTEPNIKVPNDNSIVLATNFTVKNCEILKSCNYPKIALPKLSKMIDLNYPNLDVCDKYLRKKLKKVNDVENVVLGCTHYTLVKENITKILGPVNFFDSVEGVSNRVKELTTKISNEYPSFEIVLSKENEFLLQSILDYLKN